MCRQTHRWTWQTGTFAHTKWQTAVHIDRHALATVCSQTGDVILKYCTNTSVWHSDVHTCGVFVIGRRRDSDLAARHAYLSSVTTYFFLSVQVGNFVSFFAFSSSCVFSIFSVSSSPTLTNSALGEHEHLYYEAILNNRSLAPCDRRTGLKGNMHIHKYMYANTQRERGT